MALPRRRLVRPAPTASPEPQRQHQLQKLRLRLEGERRILARWLTRLKRAFHAVEKSQSRASRVERQITKLEGS
jgi:hypothetical protein